MVQPTDHHIASTAKFRPVRLVLRRNGSTEVALSDGSGVILHPRAERVSYFRPDGVRQRLLASCAPSSCAVQSGQTAPVGGRLLLRSLVGNDDVRQKVVAAVNLRNRFHTRPCLLPELCPAMPRQRRYARLSDVLWPGVAGHVGTSCSGEIAVVAIDKVASLTLAPHACTYSVEWWCPMHGSAHVEVAEGGASLNLPCDSYTAGQHLFTAGSAAVGVFHEHALQKQVFSVADPVPAAWVYPLLLALGMRRDEVIAAAKVASKEASCSRQADDTVQQLLCHLDRQLAAKAVEARCLFEAGLITEKAGGVVCAPLPLNSGDGPQIDARAGLCSYGSDDISPASVLGAAGGGGPVQLVWTPCATSWFHAGSGEATVEVRDGDPWLATSTLRGKFWVRSRHADGAALGVVFAGMLPASSPDACVSANIAEALKWLQHNHAEDAMDDLRGSHVSTTIQSTEAVGLMSADATGSSFSIIDTDSKQSPSGWALVRDVMEEGVGRISVFRPLGTSWLAMDPKRLVRILFADTARLEFVARCYDHATNNALLQPPIASDSFRLLDSHGEVHVRSFGEPGGSREHYYAETTRRLVARLPDEDPNGGDSEGPARPRCEAGAVLAELEARRGAVLLKLHGDCTSSNRPISAQGSVTTADNALQRSKATLHAIEGLLGWMPVSPKRGM
eukprot:gnl/TRDRNA2_/TRDRNA2_83819_c0_seq1.p1 gnl/TRDRNA2_/TRDRNA2_83819_c0~~gnl/TRDRNA2_/TRDRNA2_83819_c0_seq1.p1  ORF type:complete len:675 (+),score=101.12 gnl/TRDRNA2_/TRDRNA2_83819_c0_seq1:52-2076(+)